MNIFFIMYTGSPPNCELCHEPCYDNWQRYIDKEASEIARMHANVTALLSKFGGMTYERIETELDWLNGNLTVATKAFSGARYNTSEKLQQFQMVGEPILLANFAGRNFDGEKN